MASSAVHLRDGGDIMGEAMVRVMKRRTVVRKERRWLREYIFVEIECSEGLPAALRLKAWKRRKRKRKMISQ